MKRKIYFAAAVAVFSLGACVQGPPISATPEMTFSNIKSVTLNVGAVEVRDNYKPPMDGEHVEHTFPTPPYVAAEKLLHEKMVAGGGENVLRAVIEDASVVKEELPVTKGVEDLFVREPEVRLKAKLLVRFELYSPSAPDIVIKRVEVVSKRSRELLEETSPAERDQAYFFLTEDMMDDLSDGLRTAVKNNF